MVTTQNKYTKGIWRISSPNPNEFNVVFAGRTKKFKTHDEADAYRRGLMDALNRGVA